ncbi:bifunctional diguanylate cyclase/phosphodiesterase [uncultured Neptuniibacter sp.]|uniref:putative bifunctional diguanylate cyclase/phosphodiesterase n=1 Tax=uncultured Neptuniibacter sp. TaxID=502143 RepID=UPI002631BCFF|nr:bifunctional diguanylate cyclase/phosphodiesterase [uncultured Neptuniibacter sp.]
MSKRSAASIRSFLLQKTFIYSVLGFLVLFSVTHYAFNKSVERSAAEVAERVAKQTFNSMYLVMSQGWNRTQLESFVKQMELDNRLSDLRVTLYRGEKVNQKFGDMVSPELQETHRRVLQSGRSELLTSDQTLTYLYPLNAKEVCTNCHTNVEEGETLGVIEVTQQLDKSFFNAQKELLLTLLLVSPLPILLAFLATRQISSRVDRSIEELATSIDSIESVSDLARFEQGHNSIAFKELQVIFNQVRSLATKLNSIAVDKELLEFEIRLLEKFVITSEVVKDWREYVNFLMVDINKVMNVFTMFSIFKVDNEVFDLEIFWLQPPSDQTKKLMEQAILKRLENDETLFSTGGLNLRHNTVYEYAEPLELDEKSVELQTKSLLVETPKIGGIVGIGVHSDTIQDSTKVLVLESILSTLLNVVGSVRAIYKYTKDLEYYATRDPLTNLYNQRMFWELLDYELDRADRHDYKVALLLLDLDNFKSINDGYGHSWGDKLLADFSIALQNALGKDAIIARYGGDEFVIVLPEADSTQAAKAAELVLQAIRSHSLYYDESTNLKLTGSLGIGVYPDHAQNKKDLFMFVDNLMYRAKNLGKDQIALPDENELVDIFKEMSDKTVLVTQAIEKRELIPAFQPIVSSENGEVHAVEVLSRIQLPDNKLMGANEFIEIAESIGKVHQLDYIVMDKAFAQVKETGYSGKVFINLSPRSIVISDFIPTIRRIAENYDIDPKQVTFEITERDTVKNIAVLESFVLNLKDQGFKLAIDDFGSGFSSFHYLKHLPIDYVKIEGEFIANMANDQRDMAFVNSISSLAQELNVETVAEFVESEEVLSLVAQSGITFAQGYHIGKPTPDLNQAIKTTFATPAR